MTTLATTPGSVRATPESAASTTTPSTTTPSTTTATGAGASAASAAPAAPAPVASPVGRVPEACTRRALLRRSAAAGAVGGGALVLAACGGDDSASGTTADATTGESGGTAATTSVAAADVPVGEAVVLEVGGAEHVFAQPTAGEYVAYSAVCTHAGGIVAPSGGTQVTCPLHNSVFDAADGGAVLSGPAPSPLESETVTLDGDQLVLG